MDFLFLLFLSKPLWMWLLFIGLVIGLLAFDLGVLHKDDHEIGVAESLRMSAMYILLALSFSGFIWWQMDATATAQYLTAFVVEKTLALDNIFVIALIFGFFGIPREYQHRVLFWGILGVIVLRGIMIGLGATIVDQYHWVLYIFAAFLIFTGIKMLLVADKEHKLEDNGLIRFLKRRMHVTDEFHGHAFFVRKPHPETGRVIRYATPLFLALITIEIADLIFAVDSVPAVFTITTDPYIVYTSNIFAILGLRALFFALVSGDFINRVSSLCCARHMAAVVRFASFHCRHNRSAGSKLQDQPAHRTNGSRPVPGGPTGAATVPISKSLRVTKGKVVLISESAMIRAPYSWAWSG